LTIKLSQMPFNKIYKSNLHKLYQDALNDVSNKQTIVSRHLTNSNNELDLLSSVDINNEPFVLPKNESILCYPCCKPIRRTHPVYIYSCKQCGNKSQKHRHLTRDLTNHIALVTGGRIKLGHQIVLKLLRAGATVIATTRNPEKATKLFTQYHDYHSFLDKLHFINCDFDSPDIQITINTIQTYIQKTYGRLDILVNNAAQTIRCKEKHTDHPTTEPTNRYDDPRFVKKEYTNSWQLDITDLQQQEMEEVYRVNAIAPCLLIRTLLPLIQNSNVNPYIISVSSREGLFETGLKTCFHIHLNMAKAALNQLNRTLADQNLRTHTNKKIHIHSCDPGWISIDEYYEDTKPWDVPPLDEIDGAARILYPLFAQLPSQRRTRRHFDILKY
jgi:NAD(P)-dependent dehydrogenase (short-subunit alcohol dehydrogenase family)